MIGDTICKISNPVLIPTLIVVHMTIHSHTASHSALYSSGSVVAELILIVGVGNIPTI